MTISLIETKFFIPPAAEQLLRPRLLRLLDRCLSPRCRLALISAPAGYGKTTVVSQWLEALRSARPEPPAAAWLALDEHDNDLPRFWTYLTAAVARAVSGVGKDTLEALKSSQAGVGQADLLSLLETQINELALLERGLVIVLDDLHVLTDLSIAESLSFLIEHLPPQIKVLACTRSDPPLPLARLRARGQLVEVRMADLRFTPEEISGFMDGLLGLVPRPEQAGALGASTEGWAAGLQMAGLALVSQLNADGGRLLPPAEVERRFDAFIEGFSGKHTFVFDYLAEEVLQRQPLAMQHFLLYTSILDRFCASLCAALLQGSPETELSASDDEASSAAEAILADLERANLFLFPLDAGRQWWRYHHLFADLLRVRLHRQAPGLESELHARAAAWYEQNNFIHQAVQHALAGQDMARAVRLVKAYWQPTANQGDVGQTLEWMRALPEKLVRSDAYLSIGFCWILWLRGQPGELAERLSDAECALAAKPDIPEPELSTVVASIPLLRSILQRYQGDYPAAIKSVEWALLEISRLPELLRTLLRGVGLYQLAEVLRLSGDWQKAAQAYRDAIPFLQANKVAVAVAGAFVNLVKIYQIQGQLRLAYATCSQAAAYAAGQANSRQPAFAPIDNIFADVLRELNRLDEADRLLNQSIEMGRRSGHLPVVTEGGAILARLRLAQGDAAGAHAAMHEAIQAAQKTTVPATRAAAQALQARLWIEAGDLEQAQNWAAGAGLSPAGGCAPERGLESEWITYARLLLAGGQFAQALELLERCLTEAEAGGRAGAALEINVLRAILLERLGRTEHAHAALLGALAGGYEQGYRRVFLDEGDRLAGLLRAVQAKADAPIKGFIQGLLVDLRQVKKTEAADQPGTATSPAQPLPEPLTSRELEVLRLLADGHSNRDIANALFVTEGTVKTHMHNLIAKLGAQSRTQAIARARELKLL